MMSELLTLVCGYIGQAGIVAGCMAITTTVINMCINAFAHGVLKIT